VYLGSGGNRETHAMPPDELFRLYAVGIEECRGKVPVHANLPEEHTAEQTIAQARTAIAAGVEALHLYSLIRSDRNDLSRESCSGGWDQYR
jgi:dihydrodipicolinate synthase/N-acetylneuraminate lyase